MTIRVVVVEDSPTARALLLAILASEPELEVVAEATDGQQAIELAKRLRPDVMTIDLHLPGMDGLEAIRRIMMETPTPIVVVSASVRARDIAASMDALRAGALTALPKPSGLDAPDFAEQSRQITTTVKAMSEVRVVRRWPKQRLAPRRERPLTTRSPGLIAVAASTGGPAALYRIFSELPARLAVPILVVQHISQGFSAGLVQWWSSASALPIKIAQAGEKLAPGTIYVAPDAMHLGVSERGRLLLSQAPPIEGHRPSATFLFDSAAKVYGPEVAALILTGMGRDGVDGLRAVHERGGYVIAQDQESSIVFGMPGSAIREGLADAVLPLPSIAAHVASLVGEVPLGVSR